MAANVNNYISAANAAVSKNVRIRKALADNKPNYANLANASVNQAARNRANVAANNASTAQTAIKGKTLVEGQQIKADTEKDIRGINKKARMTGMLAGGAALLGIGAIEMNKKEEPDARLELLQQQSGYWQNRYDQAGKDVDEAEARYKSLSEQIDNGGGKSSGSESLSDSGGSSSSNTNNTNNAIESTATDTYPGGKVSFDSVREMAKTAGSKFPELVAAQWALESDWGNKPSGKNNYFGIKAGSGESGTTKGTWEVIDGKEVNTSASFKNFDSPSGSVNELVNKWYKDFGDYKGVNRANDASEAAGLLTVENYATDPNYASKLRDIMSRQGF